MRLYLVQHGEARTEADDPDRPLTDRGAGQVRQVARSAAGLISVTRVVHSGKTRARQTAEIWAQTLGVEIEASDGLSPGDEPKIWIDRLTDDDLMLVGHLPHLARLAGVLLVGDADRPLVTFRNAGLVGLERSGDQWSVDVVIPPGVGSM